MRLLCTLVLVMLSCTGALASGPVSGARRSGPVRPSAGDAATAAWSGHTSSSVSSSSSSPASSSYASASPSSHAASSSSSSPASSSYYDPNARSTTASSSSSSGRAPSPPQQQAERADKPTGAKTRRTRARGPRSQMTAQEKKELQANQARRVKSGRMYYMQPLADALKHAVKDFTAEQYLEDIRVHFEMLELWSPRHNNFTLPLLERYREELLAPAHAPAMIDEVATCAAQNRYLADAVAAIDDDPFTYGLPIIDALDDPANAKYFFHVVSFSMFLDRLVKCMREHPAVTNAVFSHLASAHHLAKGLAIVRSQGWFSIVKMISVQAAMHNSIKYIRPASLDNPDAVPQDLNGWLLPLNIIEASFADLENGMHDNALVGAYLIHYRNGAYAVDQPNGAGPSDVTRGRAEEQLLLNVKHAYPRYWSDLYHSWNMDFVSTVSENWPVYWAFLANVQTMCEYQNHDQNPYVYMHNRVWALYIGLMSVMSLRAEVAREGNSGPLFERARLIESAPVRVDPERHMARVWGRQNLLSAELYTKLVENSDAARMAAARAGAEGILHDLQHPSDFVKGAVSTSVRRAAGASFAAVEGVYNYATTTVKELIRRALSLYYEVHDESPQSPHAGVIDI